LEIVCNDGAYKETQLGYSHRQGQLTGVRGSITGFFVHEARLMKRCLTGSTMIWFEPLGSALAV